VNEIGIGRATKVDPCSQGCVIVMGVLDRHWVDLQQQVGTTVHLSGLVIGCVSADCFHSAGEERVRHAHMPWIVNIARAFLSGSHLVNCSSVWSRCFNHSALIIMISLVHFFCHER